MRYCLIGCWLFGGCGLFERFKFVYVLVNCLIDLVLICLVCY